MVFLIAGNDAEYTSKDPVKHIIFTWDVQTKEKQKIIIIINNNRTICLCSFPSRLKRKVPGRHHRTALCRSTRKSSNNAWLFQFVLMWVGDFLLFKCR